jgi:hypothetical protein
MARPHVAYVFIRHLGRFHFLNIMNAAMSNQVTSVRVDICFLSSVCYILLVISSSEFFISDIMILNYRKSIQVLFKQCLYFIDINVIYINITFSIWQNIVLTLPFSSFSH